MNFHNIKYFLAIAEESSISKAAEHLHISQQSLSELLKKMEDEVDAKLVNRGRQITLTPAGKIFKRSGTELLTTYQEMLDEIATVSGKNKTKIALAVPSTEIPPFLPGLLSEFAVEYPEYSVKIIKCQPKEAAKQSVGFDLFFSTLPLGDDLEHVMVQENGTYVAAFTPGLAQRIYGDRWPEVEQELLEKRDISVLWEMPFILLNSRTEDVVLDQQIIIQEAGFQPNIAFQSENNELNANMCTMGAGVYLGTMDHCSRRFVKQINQENGILLYPIDTSIDPVGVALSYRKGMRLSKVDRCFIEVTREYLKQPIT